MKKRYLDIMEKALSAYTIERIQDFITDVRREGLTEHGFPRLGANIGILMAHGRKRELKNLFIEIIELCLEGFMHPLNPGKAGNNFAIREVCCAISELEKTDIIEKDILENWKKKIASFDIPTVYTHIVSEEDPTPANWACFGIISELARGTLCGIDATEFVDHQLPSQFLRIDENGMYRDDEVTGPYQPMVYDIVTRSLIGFALIFGYKGKYAQKIEDILASSDDLTLKMQSVTGELAFGGRSNQCTHNEMMEANYYEMRATLLKRKGEFEKAKQFKAAAEKAVEAAFYWLDSKPMSHIKNCYDPDQRLGCEDYSYFNKYMITVASNAYLAYLAADDSIEATSAVADQGGYVVQTSNDFHKVFLNAGGYFLEIDCNADVGYDASGLGRVHKEHCDSRVCLSVPFPDGKAEYNLETPNITPMSICGFKNTTEGNKIAAYNVKYVLSSRNEKRDTVSAVFDCIFEHIPLFRTKYSVESSGVTIELDEADGMFLPAILYDGKEESEIILDKDSITIRYKGCFCKYTFIGEYEEHGIFFNRNGRYRVYKVLTDKVHIELGK